MGDSADFTFCQVGLQVDNNCLDSHKHIPSISEITLEDKKLNSIQDDNLHGNERLKASGSKSSPSTDVSDILPSKSKLNESSTGKTLGETGHLINQSEEQKPVIKKPAARAKVPFEKGYSQMDWLKLTRTEPDLAGLKGQSSRRLISINEVKQHKTEGPIWTVLKGRVYNISPYMKFHPGGADMLMQSAGKDCTALFNKYHAWVNAEFLLEKCLVGVLDDSS